MYVSDLVNDITQFRDKIEPKNDDLYAYLDYIIDQIKIIEETSVQWSVDDFLFQALGNEDVQMKDPNIEFYEITMDEAHKYLNKYDPAKFQYALERMIDKHDASIGITWNTIDFFLDEYCLKS